ncbi:MAG TPA: hypothetical protein PKD16_18380 [Saprospiraceae bacterium]|jgi:hypothetical protein|nr:hypothetical protein [Saprospiraceae bacterium]
MKSKIVILISIIVIFLLGCEEKSLVSFNEPQPKGINNLNEFPKKLIGEYYDFDTKTNLIISKTFIEKKQLLKDTLKVSELDSNEVVKNDYIINLKTNEKIKIIKINDTTFVTNYDFTRRIFSFDDGDLIRKYKGYYFLNLKSSSTDWEVKKLFLKKGVLSINEIQTETEIEVLKNILDSKSDTIRPFGANPTKRQFKEFLKNNGFSSGELYLKK